MSGLDNIRRQIAELNHEETESLLISLWFKMHEPGSSPEKWRSPESWWRGRVAGIESTPDVCGGDPRIVRTRIPVWTLERMRQLGMPEAEILKNYPTLRAEDLVHAWDYVDLHRPEIDQQIRDNEEA